MNAAATGWLPALAELAGAIGLPEGVWREGQTVEVRFAQGPTVSFELSDSGDDLVLHATLGRLDPDLWRAGAQLETALRLSADARLAGATCALDARDDELRLLRHLGRPGGGASARVLDALGGLLQSWPLARRELDEATSATPAAQEAPPALFHHLRA